MLPEKRSPLKNDLILFFVAVVTAVVGAGCTSAGEKRMTSENDILNRKVTLLTEQLDRQIQQVERLQKRVSDLQIELSDRKTLAANPLPVTKLKPKKSAQTEIRSVPVQKLRPGSSTQFGADDLDREDATTIADSSNELMHLYFQGLEEQRAGNYEKALRLFREFVQTNPTHVYADRAQFQVVNTHYMNKEYSLAVVASTDLETKYSYSLKLPDALYMRAASFQAMGQEEPSHVAVNRLLKYFPKDPATLMATQKLAVRSQYKPTVPLLPKGQR